MFLLENPPMPFNQPIYGGLPIKAEIVITARAISGPQRGFAVNFRREERHFNWIKMNEIFTLKIVVHAKHFKIYVNNKVLCRFDHRIPVSKVTHLEVTGDVQLRQVVMHNINTAPIYGFAAPQPYPPAPYPVVQTTSSTTTYPAPYPNVQPQAFSNLEGKHYLFIPPALCSPAKTWNFNGRDLVKDYKGHILLLSFISLGCGQQCEKQLEKYKTIVERLNGDIRILVMARFTESADLVRQMANRYPAVRIEHEKQDAMVWSWFGAKEDDHFIFDRCSRLAKFVYHNQSNPMDDNFHETFLALKSAIDYANCGWCEYNDIRRRSNTSFYSSLTSQKTDSRSQGVLTPIPEVQPPKITINLRSRTLHADFPNNSLSNTTKVPARQLNPQNAIVGQQLYGELGQQPNQYRQHYASSTTTTSTSPQYSAQTQGQQQELLKQRQEQDRILQYHQQQRHLQEQQQRQNSLPSGQFQKTPQNKPLQWNSQPSNQVSGAPQPQWNSQPALNAPSKYYNQQPRGAAQPSYQQPVEQVTYPKSVRPQGFAPPPQNSQASNNYFDRNVMTTTPLGERPSFGSGNSYRDTERQKEYDRRQQQIKAQQQQKEQAKQLAELQRQHHAQQQLALQQQHQLLLQQQKQKEEQEKATSKKKGSNGAEPAPLYPEGSEDYYEDYNSEWTTVIPQLQIPTPTSHPLWPTVASLSELNKDYGLELPCASYTDEICYQQQTQLKANEVHKCCKGRILLTDQCVPGKCSNVTQQLCCIQKFLQAKLSCCSDERQLEETEAGDRFSHCCYTKFVDDEDTCCSSIYATTQWKHVHELCLPNIQMDLSKIKVPTILSGTTLVTEYDFGKTEKWRFECKYGAQVPQFSYFEDLDDYNNGKLPYAKK
uniref:Galectin domain-containing protein n=1 Tax=Ditylenchus dipsaci TaxID=166011 RepID=A0A915DNH6_9BILA